MNKNDDRTRIDAILRHLGCGGELRNFPATDSEKLALIRTAGSRRLVAWHKGRARYELTPIGWSELTPRRRFGLGSLMVSTALGATVGAAVLGFFWVSADASRLVAPSPVARAEKAMAAPIASAPAYQPPSASPAVPPAPGALAGTPPEPAKVAEQPVPPEPSAEAAPVEVKQAAVKKPRRKTASRRRTDETGAAWAYADSWRARPSGYAGYGGQPSSGGQGFGFFR